ncbi:MAG: hypothetical protein BWY67_01676 [Bacteroidetes bacterium ADurb.Bin397]|nr:MAG: hypothetical protein BWY67_01676 [Bacteroidetes bacterium ADurb.Bin397]
MVLPDIPALVSAQNNKEPMVSEIDTEDPLVFNPEVPNVGFVAFVKSTKTLSPKHQIEFLP